MAEPIAIVALEGVTRTFPTAEAPLTVLRGVDLAIAPGETLAVTGPSGSGKTTLLNLLAGLDHPTSGVRRFDGVSTEGWDESRLAAWRREKVGFIFQDFRLLPRLTAVENVALPLELLGRSAREAMTRARELLSGLGLGERHRHFPGQLSGGEKQRVAIARAFAHQPGIVYADEPTGNLDYETSQRVLEQLLAMHQETGTVVVTVTHDPSVAGLMGRQLRLSGGRVA